MRSRRVNSTAHARVAESSGICYGGSERFLRPFDKTGKEAGFSRRRRGGSLDSCAFSILLLALFHVQPLVQADSGFGRPLGFVAALTLAHLLRHDIPVCVAAVVPAPINGFKGTLSMAEARVKAGLWVQVALRLGNANGRYGVVLRRGDADAGGILVVLRGREGMVVLGQFRAGDGETTWMRNTGPVPVDQAAVDAYLTRQVNIDPDIWVLEFDSPDLLPPFDARIV